MTTVPSRRLRMYSGLRAAPGIISAWSAQVALHLWIVGAVLALIAPVGAGLALWDLHRRAINEASDNVGNLGVVLAEQASRYVQVIDLLLQEAQSRIRDQGISAPRSWREFDDESTHRFLIDLMKNLKQAHGLALFDADGNLLNTSYDISPARFNVADREYFQYLRSHTDDPLYVSAPSVRRTTGTMSIFLGRRVSGPDGSFLGVVIASIDVDNLLSFYKAISRDGRFEVTLLRRDGLVLARYPTTRLIVEFMPAASPWFARLAQGGGTYRSPGYLTGNKLIVSATPVRAYPLVVDVSTRESLVLAGWWHLMRYMTGGAVVLSCTLVALFGQISRQMRHQEEHNAALSRGADALRASESRLRDFARTASDWFWEQDGDMRFTAIGEESPIPHRIDRSYVGETRWERNDTKLAPEAWAQHLSDLTLYKPFSDFRYSRVGHDGAVHHISVSGVPVHDESGAFVGYRGTGRDITGQIEFERQLQAAKERAEQAEALLQDAVDSVPEGFVIYDKNERLIMCNETYHARYTKNSKRMAAGTRYADIVTYGVAQGVYVDAVGREEEWFAAWMERHRNQPVAEELALTDGRWVLVTEGRMRNGGVSGLRIDITALKQAQAALHESEARLDRAQRIARIGSWELDVTTGCYQWSKEMYRIRGLPVDEFEPSIGNLLQYIYPDDRPVARKWVAALKQGNSPGRTEFRIVRPNGDVRWVSVEDGEQTDSVGKLAGTMQDVTERRLIEQQLAQAQKMEAIGNLTGGMAHDFNNLLGVISGNVFLLTEALKGNSELEEFCRDAAEAANRGAELTSRLLAFGRRQSLQPQATNVNQLITETTRLLSRILGEDITVELRLGEGLRSTIVDPAQLEAAIANLVTNARDAMPKGGKLTIATSAAYLDADYAALYPDVVAGDYKLIEVTDTGTGMPPDVKARIFEPFFTTKPLGKGTGLGLSMVFGFIKQSGGHISVYSEPGRGTTICLYIPYRSDTSEPVAVAPPRRIVGGDEHILLVEDDAAMRRVAARQLKELGYAVTDAESAVVALQILDRGTTFDLLLTDVVMPGEMDGIDLATAAAQRCPRLKVLLMSGFPEARFEQRAADEVRPRLITKPFHRGVLATVLRELLDSPPPGEGPLSPAFVSTAE